MNDLLLILYLGGANVHPPGLPAELSELAGKQPTSLEADELFRRLLREALKLIDKNISKEEGHRTRLGHRWAALALQELVTSGRLSAADAAPYLHHLEDARDVRESAEVLLRVAPDLSTHFLKQVTGASAMTVGRARETAAAV